MSVKTGPIIVHNKKDIRVTFKDGAEIKA